MPNEKTWTRQRHTRNWRNSHSSECPAGGFVAITGAEAIGNNTLRWIGTRPPADGAAGDPPLFYAINGETKVSAGGDGYDVGEATLTGAAAVAGTWSVGDQIGPGIDSWTPVSGTSHVVVYVGSGSGAVTIAEPLFGGGSVVKYGTIVTPTSCPPNTTGITLNLREGGTLSGVKYDEDMGTNQTLTAGTLVQIVQVTESGSTFWRISDWPCPDS